MPDPAVAAPPAEGTTTTATGAPAGSGTAPETPASPPATPPASESATPAAEQPKTDASKTDASKTETPKEGVPETYDLQLPTDSPLDAAALERTAATARALGLSQAQAAQLVEAVNAEAVAQRDALLAAHQPGGTAWTAMIDGWKAQVMTDPALGSTPEERVAAAQRGHQVVEKYCALQPDDADAFKGFLNSSGLGNHPAAVRFFNWLGTEMGERSLAMPSTRGTASDADKAARMYPTMQQ